MIIIDRVREQHPEAAPSEAIATRTIQIFSNAIEGLHNPATVEAAVAAVRELPDFNLQHYMVTLTLSVVSKSDVDLVVVDLDLS